MRPICSSLLALVLGIAPLAADALPLDLPFGARQTAADVEEMGSYALPVSAYYRGQIETIWTEGEVRRAAYEVPNTDATTLQILEPLRMQLQDAGFEVLFECDARACGGFQFRFGTDVMRAPVMHVDLGNYRYLAAQRTVEDAPEYVSLVVSRAAGRAFVQTIRVGEPAEAAPEIVASAKNVDAEVVELAEEDGSVQPLALVGSNTIVGELETVGRVVLSDLVFRTGSSALGEGTFDSLSEIAAYLAEDPARRITLVGHTDADGALSGNMALSRKRAASVMARLVQDHGVPSGQLEADGVGYLVPLASNETEEGRRLNRRVEAVLKTAD